METIFSRFGHFIIHRRRLVEGTELPFSLGSIADYLRDPENEVSNIYLGVFHVISSNPEAYRC